MYTLRVCILSLFALLAGIPVIASAAIVPLSADAAFLKASQVLVGLEAMPTFRDKELLIIKTEPVPVKLTPEQVDCGKMWGIPYAKDKRTKTAAVYQVSIKPIDAVSSDVSVKVSIDGYMDVTEGLPFFVAKTRDKNSVLNCTSKGYLESQFLVLMDSAQAPAKANSP